MVDDAFVREIIETYSFTQRTREKLIRIAIRQIQEKGITSADGVWRYVDSLVEKFQEQRKPPVQIVDLDAPRGQYHDMTLHDVVGVDDPNIQKLLYAQ